MNNLLLVCVKPEKWTSKNKRIIFKPSVVNKQVERIRKWCDANVYVFTNFSSDEFDDSINIINVPDEPQWKSWWAKIYMYANSPKGLNVYVDLDSEFHDKGDIFWEWGKTRKPVLWFLEHWDYHYGDQGNCCSRRKECDCPRINGSVIRWTDNELSFVYEEYLKNWQNIQNDYFFGDDHFLSCHLDRENYYVWPKELIHSFPEIVRKKVHNNGLERLEDFPIDMLEGEDSETKGYKIFTYPSNIKPLLLRNKFPVIDEYWGDLL